MSKINVLDSSIFNRIAAGEVVERPASVVKELIENSIDAGATSIRIEIEEGGIKKIKISDDGCGIENDDAQKAFLPHATSKIKTVDDLEQIGTLGFRGEALASIASVAQVELVSKTKNSEVGQKVKINGGVVEENNQVGSPDGTYITVKNLFYNVPARAKFLKTPRREETEITNLIARFILANPKISFTYTANKREVYRSTGKSLEEAIYSVYGKKTLENVVPFKNKVGDITLAGYVGKPSFSKSNRTYQTLIINGRYVINSVVSAAAYGAYQNYLMKGKFPFFIISISMPLNSLDVNVHPNKLDVKFENSQSIYGIIHSTITSALMEANNTLKVESEDQVEQIKITPENTYNKNEGVSFSNSNIKQATQINIEASSKIQNQQTQVKQKQVEDKAKLLSSFLDISPKNNKSEFRQNDSVLTNALHTAIDSNSESKLKTTQTSAFENVIGDSSNIKLVGKVFNTYLLVEKDNSMFLIDQHAAHEKLLYDKLVKEVNAKEQTSQGLLIPHILNVNHLEEAFILENIEAIKSLGFDIDHFGNLSFKVSSVPLVLSGINIDLFFNEILKDMSFINKNKASDLIKEHLMQASCKAAVKGGTILNELEIKTLLLKMHESNMTLLCPHGRPVIVEVTRKEMDKWFKRIL